MQYNYRLLHIERSWILTSLYYSGFQAMVDIWEELDDLDAIIGPLCSTACQPVALLAAAWNMPVISYGCSSTALSDTEQYPTFV